MRLFFLIPLFIAFSVFSQEKSGKEKNKLSNIIVEAACGKCCFKSKGMKKCGLAVKIDGKVYPVEGKKLEDFGNPISKNGLCRTVRKAEVSGEIVNNNFLAYDFKILPQIKEEVPLIKEDQPPPIEDKL